MSKKRSEDKRENPIITALMLLLILVIFIVVLPFLIPGMIKGVFLRLRFQQIASREGKFILLVYSDSPLWKSYFEQSILPDVQEHAVVLNWSERSQWNRWSWPVQAFRHWGGSENFNPLAIVFCGLTRLRIFRFYRAFREYKRGKVMQLRKMEDEFLATVKTESERRAHSIEAGGG